MSIYDHKYRTQIRSIFDEMKWVLVYAILINSFPGIFIRSFPAATYLEHLLAEEPSRPPGLIILATSVKR